MMFQFGDEKCQSEINDFITNITQQLTCTIFDTILHQILRNITRFGSFGCLTFFKEFCVKKACNFTKNLIHAGVLHATISLLFFAVKRTA